MSVALDRPCEFDFQKRPLQDVVGFLTQKHAISIQLDDKALGAEGIGADFQNLIEVVARGIAPTTWDEVGGPGEIESLTNAGTLVISQTAEIHEQIAAYLKALREIAAAAK